MTTPNDVLLVRALSECDAVIQERMIRHTPTDPDYGRSVAEGLGRSVSSEAAE